MNMLFKGIPARLSLDENSDHLHYGLMISGAIVEKIYQRLGMKGHEDILYLEYADRLQIEFGFRGDSQTRLRIKMYESGICSIKLDNITETHQILCHALTPSGKAGKPEKSLRFMGREYSEAYLHRSIFNLFQFIQKISPKPQRPAPRHDPTPKLEHG